MKDNFGRELFESVCSECGDKCMLPFKPDGRRPVFCKSCWQKRKSQD